MANRKILIETLLNPVAVKSFVSSNAKQFPNSDKMTDEQLMNDVLTKAFRAGIIQKTSIARIFAMNPDNVIKVLKVLNVKPSSKDLRNKILLTEALSKKGNIADEDVSGETNFPHKQFFIDQLIDLGFYSQGMSSLDIVLKLAILCLTCGALFLPGSNIPFSLTEDICPECVRITHDARILLDFQEEEMADEEYYNDYEDYGRNQIPTEYYEQYEQPEYYEQYEQTEYYEQPQPQQSRYYGRRQY